MTAVDVAKLLFEATVASSLALLLALALRRPLRAVFGARIAYGIWALLPVALIAVLLPAAPAPLSVSMLPATVFTTMPVQAAAGAAARMSDPRLLVVALWLLGVAIVIGMFARQQRRFRARLGRLHDCGDGLRQADGNDGLPAVFGWWRPAVVLPADFETRYSAGQRALMLAHERAHIARGDLHANAIAMMLRCLFWFNPLLHVAARRFRHDQELACDAHVIAHHPRARRIYGEALLHTQLSTQTSPLGCHFGFGHPLKERIAMLKQPIPSSLRWLAGSAVVAVLALVTGFATWAAQPKQIAISDELIDVRMQVQLNGATVSTPRIINHNGRPFSIRSDEIRLFIELTATTRHDGKIDLAGYVYRDNKRAGEIKVQLMDAHPETFDFGPWPDKSGRSDLLTLTVDASTASARVALPLIPPPPAPQAVPPAIGVRTYPLVTAALAERPAPVYPSIAAKQGIGGMVILVVDVAADGQVTDATVEKSEPAGRFDAAALAAVKKWRFNPPRIKGKTTVSRVRVPVQFTPHAVKPGDERL
ncbi:MAG: TonB family protein [Luteimonas sp.]